MNKLEDKLYEIIGEHLPKNPTNEELIEVIRVLTLVTAEVTEEFVNEMEDRA